MVVVERGLEPQVGQLLRQWRDGRRLSQLELANRTGVSARHLSFLETGRARPSREMVIRLADQLDVPLRERNHLLLAAGYAPMYAETALAAPQMAAIRSAVRQVLAGHNPYPALVVDRYWNIVEANSSFALFTEGVAAELLQPPVNVLRLALHPKGMAPRIGNLGAWRAHLLGRLRRRIVVESWLLDIYEEVRAYRYDYPVPETDLTGSGDISVPLCLRHGDRELAFVATLTTFGAPQDVTVAELVIESFFPADEETAAALHRDRLAPAYEA
jgi:transcriptional regulator with XRE-family HTH domain